MALLPAKCPECGEFIEVDNEKRAGLCQHCNQPFVVEDAIQSYNIYEIKSKGFFISNEGELIKYCGSNTDVIIPDNVTEITSSSFKDCKNIISITIPDSITNIHFYAFNDCIKLASIIVDEKNISYSSADGVLFNKDKTTLIKFPIAKEDNEYEIPVSVKKIARKAFLNCANLTSIKIPDSVTSIGNEAFKGTAYYDEPKNWENNILYIGNHLIEAKTSIFGGCIIKSGTKIIEERAFKDCTNLAWITIPNSVTSIKNGAFFDCTNLASVSIPDSVTSIGTCAFSNCTSLASVRVPSSVINIGNNTFDGCTNLTSISLSNGVTIIGRHAFDGCTSLTSITIPNSVTDIYAGAFRDCKSLESITFPDNLRCIGVCSFYNCTNLTSITIPDNIKHISKRAFDNCFNLKIVNISYEQLLKSKDAFSKEIYEELLKEKKH